MSIRLDPRRLGTLKRLAAEAGVRPGDLVRQWVEERIDASRAGADGKSLAEQIEALTARVEALEASRSSAPANASSAKASPAKAPAASAPAASAQPQTSEAVAQPQESGNGKVAPKKRGRRVSAAPRERVALHDEMIAVLGERGPMTAAELAGAIVERGRYAPPRSSKPLDAAMVSQRVSNPTYRSRFVRNDGRIGLAE
jgi:hypothetical protein